MRASPTADPNAPLPRRGRSRREGWRDAQAPPGKLSFAVLRADGEGLLYGAERLGRATDRSFDLGERTVAYPHHETAAEAVVRSNSSR